MNISRIFIERPVFTTLLMAALVIFGVFGYFSLPVSDLPNVDFPTIQVSASLPGADPDTMASGVAAPLENQFSTIAGIDSMTSLERRAHRHHHPVHAGPQHRRRRSGRAGGDLGRPAPAAPVDAAAAHLPQGQPGRFPDHVHRHVVGHDCTHRAGRICRDLAGAPAFHHRRRRPGQRVRQVEICRAHPGRSRRAGRPPDRHRYAVGCGRLRQRQPGDRRAERHRSNPPSSTPTASSTTPRNSATRSSPIAMARRCG